MTRRQHHHLLVISVIALPVLGYALAHGFTLAVPPSEHGGWYFGLLTLFFALLLMAVPFWMLKLGSRARHDVNSHEREMELKDIPKDKDQLNRSL